MMTVKFLFIGLLFTMIFAAACAPSPQDYTESDAFRVRPTRNAMSGFTPMNPMYILDLGGSTHKIEIYRQNEGLLYAIDPDGGRVLESDEIQAVLAKLTQENYSVYDVELYPSGAKEPFLMFIRITDDTNVNFDQEKDEIIVLLEDVLGN